MNQIQMNFTSVHPNSFEVYKENVLPNLSQRENDVLNAYRYLGPSTLHEVAAFMKVFPHTISGRVTALKKKGLIKIVGIKKINGRPNDILEVV